MVLESNDQDTGFFPKPSPFTHFYLDFHISLTFSLLLTADFSKVQTIINSNLKPLFRQSATSTYTSTHPLHCRHPRPRAQFSKSKPGPRGISKDHGGGRRPEFWALDLPRPGRRLGKLGPGLGVSVGWQSAPKRKNKLPSLISQKKKKLSSASAAPTGSGFRQSFPPIFARKRQCNDYRR